MCLFKLHEKLGVFKFERNLIFTPKLWDNVQFYPKLSFGQIYSKFFYLELDLPFFAKKKIYIYNNNNKDSKIKIKK